MERLRSRVCDVSVSIVGESVPDMASAIGLFSILPPDLIDGIVKNLPTKDIVKLSLTCKGFVAICIQDSLWQRKWLSGYFREATFKGSWRAVMYEIEAAPRDVIASLSRRPPPSALSDIHHRREQYRRHFEPQWNLPAEIPPHLKIAFCYKGEGLPGSASMPQVWTGLMDDWSTSRWKDAEYMRPLLQTKFRVAKPFGGSCLMPLADYLQYACQQNDEEPLYIFDEDFVGRAPCMAKDYAVPEGTPEDLFSVMGSAQPDYRWLVMGPKRSGSSWHQDPSGTCAWNALVAGTKRWLFYPPDVTPPGINISVSDDGDQDIDSPNPVEWLLSVYPFLPAEKMPFEHIQKPGEIVFLPSGWWHFILNVTETIAVTQNYIPLAGLEGAVQDLAWGSGHKVSAGAGQESIDRHQSLHVQHRCGEEEELREGFESEAMAKPRTLAWASGFRRSMHLGSWLATLAAKNETLQPLATSLAQKYCNLDEWHQKLNKILETSHLGPTVGLWSAFPMRGGQTVVFRIGKDVVVKVYSKDMQLSLLDAYTELSAFEAIQGTDAEALFPRLLASSMPSSQDSLQTALAMDSEQAQQPIPPISELPWVVLEQCSERPLSAAEISEDCAVALGKAVASLHAVHRDSNTFFKDEDIWTEALDHRKPERLTLRKAWEPFTHFIQRRRLEVHTELFSTAALPLRLLEQLEGYLPKAIEDVLPLDHASHGLPCFLHGDLTPDNILQECIEGQPTKIRLIDLGDSGFGDPLFDLAPLHVGTFRGNRRLTELFLKSYASYHRTGLSILSSADKTASYRAMCYTLFHEQGLLSHILNQKPSLWGVNSLAYIQSDYWGFLDTLKPEPPE